MSGEGFGRCVLLRMPMANFLSDVLRVAALSLVTFVAFGLSWQLASLAATSADPTFDLASRVQPASRRVAVSARYGAAGASGYAAETDRFRASASGSVLALASGLRVTVVEGGAPRGLRVLRGSTVGAALDQAGVAVGPLDKVVAREDGTVAAGDTITVVRVSEAQIVVREPIPFPVQTVNDGTLAVGKVVVATPGVPGQAENTYLVTSNDGVEAGRALVASVELAAPVAEVRRVGTFRPPPPAGGDIESIIRAAAAQWGADPTQLLRVAYCESRYNPSAYNASSGASGLFQFLASTWAANSVRAGYGGASVFDPVANANTAAYMFAHSQAGQWACK